jgi:hypothetical protein
VQTSRIPVASEPEVEPPPVASPVDEPPSFAGGGPALGGADGLVVAGGSGIVPAGNAAIVPSALHGNGPGPFLI